LAAPGHRQPLAIVLGQADQKIVGPAPPLAQVLAKRDLGRSCGKSPGLRGWVNQTKTPGPATSPAARHNPVRCCKDNAPGRPLSPPWPGFR
jgi:hypothetical protein